MSSKDDWAWALHSDAAQALHASGLSHPHSKTSTIRFVVLVHRLTPASCTRRDAVSSVTFVSCSQTLTSFISETFSSCETSPLFSPEIPDVPPQQTDRQHSVNTLASSQQQHQQSHHHHHQSTKQR